MDPALNCKSISVCLGYDLGYSALEGQDLRAELAGSDKCHKKSNKP